ncbi:MAG: ComEC/Rec2 family competence protein [Flavobacteriales bacterium]|nr:ComEC/Rec2 family competence protein [Flavobacteriales bacterium]
MSTTGSSIAWSAFVRAPMMRVTLAFVAGDLFALWRPPPLPIALGALVLSSVLVLLVLTLRIEVEVRWRRGPILLIWCFVFGSFWQLVRDPLSHPAHAMHAGAGEHLWALRITAINGISEKVVRGDAEVLGVRSCDRIQARTGKVMVTLMRHPNEVLPVPGDEILIRTTLEPIARIPDPGGFDRRAWAASRGIYQECFAVPQDWRPIGHASQWFDIFESSRVRVSDWLVESGLPQRQRAMVKALVLGLRDELEGEQRDAFVHSGTIHILAVSGTHVGFIYLMLMFLFRWMGGGSKARIWRGTLVLVALWCYAGLTGAHPSVLRATIMFSLFTVAGMARAQAEPLNSLCIAALGLLLWDPHMIMEVGFQLSFLAVLGILLFHGPMERSWVPNNKCVGYVWSLMVMSVAAQLLTTPLTLYLFGAFPVWFLPANLIVVTAAGFAVYGAVGLLVVQRIPILGPVVVFLLTLLLQVVDSVTAFFAGLPGAYPAVRIDKLDVVLLFLLVLSIAMRSIWKWRPAGALALGVSCALVLGWGWRSHRAHERTTFTVYDDRQAMQAAFTVGRAHVVLSEDTLAEKDPWVLRKVDRHQRAQGTDPALFITTRELNESRVNRIGGTVHGGGLWATDRFQVGFMSEGHAPKGRPMDVLVVHDLRYVEEDQLAAAAVGSVQVVLAGSLSWKSRRFIQRWCSERDIPVHDVRDRGAFRLEG